MFSRVVYENFQLLFPVIGFFLIFAVFLGVIVKVFLMKKKRVDRLSRLPLEDDEQKRPAPGKENPPSNDCSEDDDKR